MENQTAETSDTNKSDDINDCLQAEIDEINKFKWYLGERLLHDPLQDRSLNDIAMEWIQKYAADFRKYWQNRNSKPQQENATSV